MVYWMTIPKLIRPATVMTVGRLQVWDVHLHLSRKSLKGLPDASVSRAAPPPGHSLLDSEFLRTHTR